jgi:predicted TIM-barrel fold metal-dependent hydrolase
VGRLLGRGRGIRAAGPLLEVLNATGLVDQHAHAILRDPPRTLDEFRGLFTESPDPRQWPHVATAVTYRRAVGLLAQHLGCEPNEEAVFRARLATDPEEYTASLLQATGTERLLVDTGFPPPQLGLSWQRMGELAGCAAHPVLRIEALDAGAVRERVASARADGFVALKTIAAYRGGLDRIGEAVVETLEANADTGSPLPLQVHAGFGDSDLHLQRADPSYLKPVVERFAETPFVLLHCYPFVREAGWLAHVYPNVWLDLSLTIPHVWRGAELVREALELAPVSKLLYASDAARTPELFFLAARWWREALAEVLAEALPAGEAEEAGRAILRENALELYELG